MREGSLLAFLRGARQVLVHNNCAEFSPEVEVLDSKWKNVIKAANRGKLLSCSLCSVNGATVGCSAENCFRVFHFSCAEDIGWRFERDGKSFFCDLHRLHVKSTVACDRVSTRYMSSKMPSISLQCYLCQLPEDESAYGPLLAFQRGMRLGCVHESCIKHTTIVDVSELENSRMGQEYQNVFLAIDMAKPCLKCLQPGATIACAESTCEGVFHFQCARSSGWNFDKNDRRFRCELHRSKAPQAKIGPNGLNGVPDGQASAFPRHNLLAQFGATPKDSRISIPSNLDMGGTAVPGSESFDVDENDENSESGESFSGPAFSATGVLDVPLAKKDTMSTRLVRVERPSRSEVWGFSFKLARENDALRLAVESTSKTGDDTSSIQVGDIVTSINGAEIGSVELRCLRHVLSMLNREVKLTMQVKSGGQRL